MITLLATAALLSCNEAQQLINRVPREYFTRAEYRDIVRTIKRNAPNRCHLTTTGWRAHPGGRRVWINHWNHPGVRPGWRSPSIVINVGTPVLTWRF
jgi:hypothetical protein